MKCIIRSLTFKNGMRSLWNSDQKQKRNLDHSLLTGLFWILYVGLYVQVGVGQLCHVRKMMSYQMSSVKSEKVFTVGFEVRSESEHEMHWSALVECERKIPFFLT